MRALVCPKCGAGEFKTINGYKVCVYCESKLILQNNEISIKSTTISIQEDVQTLLEKCKIDPRNAARYANLVLDIDPNNKEALNILRP